MLVAVISPAFKLQTNSPAVPYYISATVSEQQQKQQHSLRIVKMKSVALLVAAGSGVAFAQSVTTEIPAPAGTSLSPSPIVVSDSLDGEGFLYDREGSCSIPLQKRPLG